jgi:ribosomal protein S18 acetylase RimI-like enzyme
MVTIRVVQQDDLDQVVALWETAAGPTTLPCGIDEVRRLLDRDADALLVADAAATGAGPPDIVGTLIAGWDGWRCHMYRMTVRPDHRRGRVATDLVEAAHRRAEALGAERLDAIVDLDNPGGIAFWEGIGFTRKLNNGRWVSTERPRHA